VPVLIDGHNLIGQLPDIDLSDPNDEALLVQKLTGYAARTSKRVTVIFDGGLPGGRSAMSSRAVEVVFASSPGIADKLLLDRIKKIRDPGNWRVVSSDRVVLDAARKRGMRATTSADFAHTLNVAPPPPAITNGKPVGKRDADEDDKPTMRPLSAAELDEWEKLFRRKK
jgi:predicted RNA-binding protein with PIN domain